MRKRLIGLLTVGVVAAALTPSAPPAQAVQSAQAAEETTLVKVLSYNLRGPQASEKNRDPAALSWAKRLPHLVRLVERHGPAIFGLQEVSTGRTTGTKGARDTIKAFKSEYDYFPRRKKGSPKQIFFRKERFSIAKDATGADRTGTEVFVPRKKCPEPGERKMTWVMLTDSLSGQNILVANAHLAAKAAKCRSTRVASAKQIHAALAAANPEGAAVILLGDMNNTSVQCQPFKKKKKARKHGKAITLLTEAPNATHSHRLTPTAPASNCGQTTNPNWRAGGGINKTKKRIDWIFHSEHMATRSYAVDRRRTVPVRGKKTAPSDHLAIIARIDY